MLPLSKLWTWLGTTFIPIVFGWALYVRHASTAPSDGETVSRAYWGLLVIVALGAALLWTWFFYARAAREDRQPLAPMNTLFEKPGARSSVIGRGTVVVYGIVLATGAVLFGAAYSKSRIHGWNDVRPLADGFWSSRAEAFAQGCPDHPCWALASRIGDDGHPLHGVNEYIPYVTDGALAAAVIVLMIGFGLLMRTARASGM